MNKVMFFPAPAGNVRWDTITVAKLAGVEQQVLLYWRRHFRFLGGPKRGAQGLAGYMHDILDCLVAAAVGEIVKRGIHPEDACAFELDLRTTFECMQEGKGWPSIIGCIPQGRDAARVGNPFWTIDPELTMAEALTRSPNNTMLVLDLAPIMARVSAELGITLPGR